VVGGYCGFAMDCLHLAMGNRASLIKSWPYVYAGEGSAISRKVFPARLRLLKICPRQTAEYSPGKQYTDESGAVDGTHSPHPPRSSRQFRMGQPMRGLFLEATGERTHGLPIDSFLTRRPSLPALSVRSPLFLAGTPRAISASCSATLHRA
jgi:hypothetical protein